MPIAGIAGDQQAALFGQMCRQPGMSKNTYGTGCFLLQNIGTTPTRSTQQLVTTVAWQIGGRTEYALEGSVFIGGAVVQWLRDGLGLIRQRAEIEPLAASVADNGGVYLVPAFAGLGAPHWDPYARGTMVGITRGTTAGAHRARGAREHRLPGGRSARRDGAPTAGIPLEELRVDGGAATNNMLMQFQADLLGVPVVRPAVTETTALGAAYLAGLAVGFWKSADEVSGQWQVDRRFEPAMPRAAPAALRERWTEALGRSKGWEVELRIKNYRRSRELGLAEIGGFGAGGMIVEQFGVAGKNQEGRELSGKDNDRFGPEVAEVEFVEFSCWRDRLHPNPQRELRCIVFGQAIPVSSPNHARLSS